VVRILKAMMVYLETAMGMTVQQLFRMAGSDTVPEGAMSLGVTLVDTGHPYVVWTIRATVGYDEVVLFRGYWTYQPETLDAPEPQSPPDGGEYSGAPTLVVTSDESPDTYSFRLFHLGGAVASTTSAGASWNLQTLQAPMQDGETYTWDCRVNKGSGHSEYFSPAWSFVYNEIVG